MDLIVIGNPTLGHSFAMRMQRAIESVIAANEDLSLIIVNPNENNTSVMISELCYAITSNELHELKRLEDLSWIKLNRDPVPHPYQYKRVFRSKPNKNTTAIIQAKGFIRLQLYH